MRDVVLILAALAFVGLLVAIGRRLGIGYDHDAAFALAERLEQEDERRAADTGGRQSGPAWSGFQDELRLHGIASGGSTHDVEAIRSLSADCPRCTALAQEWDAALVRATEARQR